MNAMEGASGRTDRRDSWTNSPDEPTQAYRDVVKRHQEPTPGDVQNCPLFDRSMHGQLIEQRRSKTAIAAEFLGLA
jgi:hypothetical protein